MNDLETDKVALIAAIVRMLVRNPETGWGEVADAIHSVREAERQMELEGVRAASSESPPAFDNVRRLVRH